MNNSCVSHYSFPILFKFIILFIFIITCNNMFMVLVAPIITTPHEEQLLSITEGKNGSITCTAAGFPVPTVLWQHSNGSSLNNGRLVSGSPVITSTGIGNITRVSVELIVTQIRRQDAGMYRCSVANIINSANTNITVDVKSKSLVWCCNIMYRKVTIDHLNKEHSRPSPTVQL